MALAREIHTESFVRRNGELVPVEQLDHQERETLAVWLKETYLNELFRGKGRVLPQEEQAPGPVQPHRKRGGGGEP